jgi:hypothetical protein
LKSINSYIKGGFLFFILMNISSLAAAQQNPSPLLVEARNELPKAFENEKECIGLCNKLSQVKNPEPLLKGYVGAASIARARHASLFDKRGYLKTGTEILEEAIKEKPNSTELLFLRLTIQINLPSFLGYNDNIDADKNFVLANYSLAPPTLKTRISNFIKDSDSFTDEEKARIK